MLTDELKKKKGIGTYEVWRGNISLFFLHSQKKTELINTLKMLFSLKHTFIIAATFLLNIELCLCACARAEYEINGECCPMCAPGKLNVFKIIYSYDLVANNYANMTTQHIYSR